MDAATIIRDFTAKGVQLAPTDHGTISITPRSRLTDADRDLLRKHKAEVLAELQSVNVVNIVNIDSGLLPPARIVHETEPKFTDDYDTLERLATQEESEQPMDPDPTGTAGVLGFDDCIPITDAERFALNLRLMNPAQESTETAKSHPSTTTSTSVQPAPLRHSGPMVPALEKGMSGETIVRGFRLATPHPVPQTAPSTVTCASCAELEPGREPNSLGRCARTADGLPPVASRGYGCCFPHAPRFCSDYKEI